MAVDEILANMDYAQQALGQNNVSATSRFMTLYGMKPIGIPQYAGRASIRQGRLPDNTCFAFAKAAVGMAEGLNKNMSIYEWSPDKQQYIVGARDNFGAARIQNAGIVKLTVKA